MRKILGLICVVLLASSCSASKTDASSAKVPDVPFTATAKISYEGLDCTAELTRAKSGEWEFSLTEPYALEGLTVTLSDGETTLTMFGEPGFSDKTDNTVSMAKAAALAYDAAAVSTAQFTASDSGFTLSGTSELGTFTVGLDSSFTPVSLTSDRGGLTVSLSDFLQH